MRMEHDNTVQVNKEAVVFVHGIWMNGVEMFLLRNRIAQCGYKCHQFRYKSMSKTPKENAIKLNQYLGSLDYDIVHIVAHSLGGIVVMHLFNHFPRQRPGRVVLMGSPIHGSRVAEHIYNSGILRKFLGRAIHEGLLGNVPIWQSNHEIGMIAGTKPVGLGMLLVPDALEKPHDGTVSLDATRSDTIKEHRSVPHSHQGLLVALPVAKLVCQFLKNGRFEKSETPKDSG